MLGKLKKVELREAWKHEALDFTRWLAQEENLSLLSEEVGIGIRTLETEAKVGKFSVDILAEEDNTGRVLGLMPHPERATFFSQLPQYYLLRAEYDAKGKQIPSEGPGLTLFKNAAQYFK